MTPTRLETGTVRYGVFYELSTDGGSYSRAVEGKDVPLVGVTIRDFEGKDPDNASQVFRSVEDAREYLEELAAEGVA